MSLILPPSRRIPVVPRPRHGELSGSYLARVARANGTDLRTFAGLLGRLPALAPDEVPDLAVMVLTLNAAAFDRLLSYTGREPPRVPWRLRCFGLRNDYSVILVD